MSLHSLDSLQKKKVNKKLSKVKSKKKHPSVFIKHCCSLFKFIAIIGFSAMYKKEFP